MTIKEDFKELIAEFSTVWKIPPIADVFLPPLYENGQPPEAQFMAIGLEDDSVGISYVLLSDGDKASYRSLKKSFLIGKSPSHFALEFGSNDSVKELLGLAAINAICQYVMKTSGFKIDSTTDSLGLLSVSAADRVGMVGLFQPLIKTIEKQRAKLVIIEKDETLIKKFPSLPISLDPIKLNDCNKVLCTGTTLLNDTLDEVLDHCSPEAFISVIGPTVGYFPDPLFARGIDVIGGRIVKNGKLFLQRLEEKRPWGDATQKICFQKKTYRSIRSR